MPQKGCVLCTGAQTRCSSGKMARRLLAAAQPRACWLPEPRLTSGAQMGHGPPDAEGVNPGRFSRGTRMHVATKGAVAAVVPVKVMRVTIIYSSTIYTIRSRR